MPHLHRPIPRTYQVNIGDRDTKLQAYEGIIFLPELQYSLRKPITGNLDWGTRWGENMDNKEIFYMG